MADTDRKSIILVNFDNIFLALWQQDHDVALQFGRDPTRWLGALARCDPDGVSRRWLVARCYLNPNGWVQPTSTEKIYLSHFRPALVRAGFEIVDCPVMTRGGKNAADIRIVIDALDLLAAQTWYDEFVIASGDADFAPLLNRIRARDRRTVILAPGLVSVAYTSLANTLIDYDAMAALICGKHPPVDSHESLPAGEDGGRDEFARFIRARYDEATEPLNISTLSQHAEHAMPGARAAQWFGASSFTAAIVRLDLPNVMFAQHYLWDDTRHAPPVISGQAEDALPPTIVAMLRSMDVPSLPQDTWSALFRSIADYTGSHAFDLSEATRWCRDTLVAEGHPVARSVLNFVIRGLVLGGTPLDGTPPPDADQIARSFCDNVVRRARGTGAIVDPADEAALAGWLGVEALHDGS